VTTLYENFLKVDPKNPEMEGRDHFVLSKGHAAPTLYMVLADKGFFPKEELKTLRQMGSNLQGHPCVHKTPGVELSTGPLGLGLSAGLGMMLADRMKGYDSYTYVLMGDGEIQEGGIWEAAQTAAKYKADHLIGILDNNGVQLDGTNEEIMPLGDVTAKWEAFGWYVIDCDGHDVESFDAAVRKAKEHTGSPVLIRAKTVKGKGVSFMEGQAGWHGKAVDDASFEKAMAELGGEK
jgi:transketolase